MGSIAMGWTAMGPLWTAMGLDRYGFGPLPQYRHAITFTVAVFSRRRHGVKHHICAATKLQSNAYLEGVAGWPR